MYFLVSSETTVFFSHQIKSKVRTLIQIYQNRQIDHKLKSQLAIYDEKNQKFFGKYIKKYARIYSDLKHNPELIFDIFEIVLYQSSPSDAIKRFN